MGLLYSDYSSRITANPVTNNSISINAVSGTLSKTFRKSFFQTFKFGSRLAETIFDENNPRISYWKRKNHGYDSGYEYCEVKSMAIPIIVLQTMLCGDDRVLVEVIKQSDYEEIFTNANKVCGLEEGVKDE